MTQIQEFHALRGEGQTRQKSEILTYSRVEKAFAGLTLDGAVIRRDDDFMRAI